MMIPNAVIPNPEEDEGSSNQGMNAQTTFDDNRTIGGNPSLRSDDKSAVFRGFQDSTICGLFFSTSSAAAMSSIATPTDLKRVI